MNNRKWKRFFEKKAFLLVAALCLLSMLGMYGVYRMETGDVSEEEKGPASSLVNLNEMTKEQEIAIKEPEAADVGTESVSVAEVPQKDETAALTAMESTEGVQQEKEAEDGETAAVMAQKEPLSFSQSETVQWPVKGNIIMDYSPDNTVYFATLEQYRANPAVLIQAAAGTPVAACADGKIKEIKETDELGITLTLELGNGYEAVYGQLADVKAASGATVSAGDTLAVVAAPSKYYVVEGSHLYFQMLKGDEPLNPRAFLE